ncbi:hypothetical protein QVZ43_12505 [Marinobacter sp. chi1]|uniref:Lipase modulator n=1 Tax=Marinobacter suaedae TaxID=3057675 RepID=A0ABT8W2T9_9GAMM|nr:hypothetical protein [Marinobacter sp. chi1]MDO3722544.1 hypothetical protein [Marinobacter sp. chi1]
MNMKGVSGIACASIAIGIAAFFWHDVRNEKVPIPPANDAIATTPANKTTEVATSLVTTQTAAKDENLEDIRAQLRAHYGQHLSEPKIQIRLLEEMMRYLSAIDPEHWQENLLALLDLWFPEHGEALKQRLTALLDYKTFMEQERYTLKAMTPEERHAFMWAKRRELFGEDAEVIWQAEIRNYALATSLQQIDAGTGSPLSKVRTYSEVIQQTYEDQADLVLENRRQELTDRFLALPSIQADLQQQPASERYDTLRGIRAELGMNEDALNRWSELDRTRDQRWSKGEQYQARRETILETYESGPDRDKALNQAAREILGQEMAEIIQAEEEAGYYRYERERVYGQN